MFPSVISSQVEAPLRDRGTLWAQAPLLTHRYVLRVPSLWRPAYRKLEAPGLEHGLPQEEARSTQWWLQTGDTSSDLGLRELPYSTDQSKSYCQPQSQWDGEVFSDFRDVGMGGGGIHIFLYFKKNVLHLLNCFLFIL